MNDENNINKQTLFIDSPLYKNLTPNGSLKIVNNSEALMNAFQIWLSSAPREQVRSRSGGYASAYIYKPLTPENASSLRRTILSGLANDFTPKLTVVSLDVIADPKNRQWIIRLVAYNSDLNIGVNDLSFISNGT